MVKYGPVTRAVFTQLKPRKVGPLAKPRVGGEVSKLFREITRDSMTFAKGHLEKRVLRRASGKLIASAKVETARLKSGTGIESKLSYRAASPRGFKYVRASVFGQRPHPVPAQALVPWVRTVLGLTKVRGRPSRATKRNTLQIAYAVAHKIKLRGVPPTRRKRVAAGQSAVYDAGVSRIRNEAVRIAQRQFRKNFAPILRQTKP